MLCSERRSVSSAVGIFVPRAFRASCQIHPLRSAKVALQTLPEGRSHRANSNPPRSARKPSPLVLHLINPLPWLNEAPGLCRRTYFCRRQCRPVAGA